MGGKSGGYRRRRLGPGWTAIPAVLAAAVLLAGCGGGGSSAAVSPKTAKKALAFAVCMRSHGEPGFPDPDSNGTISTGQIDMNASSYHVAFSACGQLSPGVQFQLSAAQQRTLIHSALALAKCMRSHRIPDFPDPDVDLKTASYTFPLPAGAANSAAYQSAWNTCSRRS